MVAVGRKGSQGEREEKDNKRGEKGQGRKEGVREEGEKQAEIWIKSW